VIPVQAGYYFARKGEGFAKAQRRMLENWLKSSNFNRFERVQRNAEDGGYEFNVNAVKTYEREDRQFREKLYVAYILSCGIAGRPQENASLKFQNTRDGERNVVIEDAQIMTVSSYHKSQAMTDSLKVHSV
jgi:hypothetical protein